MSIMIKGIDMPINCTRCPCSDDETRFCRAANKYIPMLSKPSFCPLMEAEERKTGEWIRHPEQKNIYGGKCVECSACGEKYVVQHIEDEKFCRNCGADMRGEGNG